ncbi:uncharacterized protein VNE69_04045 [Vairimorpha necatrix]|uniref:Uncharacterized protein n=1 Tax=Vairimorpha necatrix TaxID=6039 RepID=A0AAX4JB87_9MICR
MFSLKKVTNFQKHLYFHIIEDKIYVITLSTVEIYDKQLNLIKILDFRDEILSTVVDNEILILTPSHFIKVFKEDKKLFQHNFKKMVKYKNFLLFVGTNKFAFYKYKNGFIELDYEYKKTFDDIIVNDLNIFIFEKENVVIYEYHSKILLKKKQTPVVHFYISSDKKHKNLVFIDDENILVVDSYERYFRYKNFTIIIYKNKSAYFDNKTMTFYDNAFTVDYCDEDCTFLITNNNISKFPMFCMFNYVKQSRLRNKLNMKFAFNYKISSNGNRIEIYENKNFFIKLNNMLKGYETDKYVIILTASKIFKYQIVENKIHYLECLIISKILFYNDKFLFYEKDNTHYIYDVDLNLKYKYKKADILDIIRENNNLIIVKNNIVNVYNINNINYKKVISKTGLYLSNIFSLFREINFKIFIEKNIKLDIKNQDFLLCKDGLCVNLGSDVRYLNIDNSYIYVYDNLFVKIYKITNIKKVHISLNISGDTFINNRNDNIFADYRIDNKFVSGDQILVYNDFIYKNFFSGISMYKSSGFMKKDPISRNIRNFHVSDNKIYCNDTSQYLIILNFDFIILGMVFIGENIKHYEKKNDKIYLKTDIGNILRIKETTTKEKEEYFSTNIKINFTVEKTDV